MFILEVVLISNIPRQNTLTYFSRNDIKDGSLVLVPYNNSLIKAISISSKPVLDIKKEIKGEVYKIKKISKVIKEEFIDTDFIANILSFSRDFFVRPSFVLYSIFPIWFWDLIFENKLSLDNSKNKFSVYIKEDSNKRFEHYFTLQKDNKTNFIITPNISKKNLSSGFDDKKVFILNSKISSKRQTDIFQKVLNNENINIITTPYYIGLSLFFSKNIILDEYKDKSYLIKQGDSSFDVRDLIGYISKGKILFTLGDKILPYSLYKYKNNITKDIKLDYTLYTKVDKRHSFLFIHKVMEDSFLTDIKNDKNILLLLKQKEDGSKVICNDCKIFLKCNICDEDLTLKIQKLKQVLYCHQCNKSFNLINKCPNCQSWNLDMLGLNKNNVTSFVKENYKFTQNIKIDTISNIDLYKKNKFDHIYLLTVDGYMFNSSFDSEEFLYRLLFDLKDMTDFLSVQTSFPAPNVLVTFKNKNYESIFNKEIEKREKLNSPPFGVYYKVEALNKRGSKILEKIVIYLDKLNISYILKNSFSLEIYIKKENKVKVEKMLNFYFSSDISVIKKV